MVGKGDVGGVVSATAGFLLASLTKDVSFVFIIFVGGTRTKVMADDDVAYDGWCSVWVKVGGTSHGCF